jgi:hypothetical protein
MSAGTNEAEIVTEWRSSSNSSSSECAAVRYPSPSSDLWEIILDLL